MHKSIKKYKFKDGLNHEFEIINLSEIMKTKRDMMIIPHRAAFYHIIILEKAQGTHYIDFKPIELQNYQILFIPKDSVNVFDENGYYEGKAIIFTDNFFCKNKEDIDFLRTGVLFGDLYPITTLQFCKQYSGLTTMFNYLETEFKRERDSEQYGILHNMLHIFLLQAERELRQQGFKELKPSINLDYLLLFKEQLEENFTQEKSVAWYSSQLSISDKQLHKATTTLLDKTPKQIIDERVLLEAKRLLVHSSSSIKEIAYSLGYDEPTNFIKYFKKHTESTPSEFRDQK